MLFPKSLMIDYTSMDSTPCIPSASGGVTVSTFSIAPKGDSARPKAVKLRRSLGRGATTLLAEGSPVPRASEAANWPQQGALSASKA